MYFSDFNGLDLLRAHASMTSLPMTNGLDTGNPLGLPLPSREQHLSPPRGSPGNLNSNNSSNNGSSMNNSNSNNNNNSSTNNNNGGVGGHLNRSMSPRPGSANQHHPHHQSATPGGFTLSSLNALNLIQTPKPGLKPPTYSSPPPIPCNPEHNICKLIDYRGAKVAAFMVDGRELICLPQAFELFLKHLVGGLHTVYTKLKRLEITPIVCNVEQVRILRGLGAIQPGVNRCKLISCSEFDTLYEDCTNSNARPGRPPKRVHANPVDADVLDKLKRRKLDMPGEYPYDQRFYDRKLMNGFPPVGYPSMPQFPNLFSMHHLMQPVSMAMASHIGLRPEGAVPKLDRTTSDSGIMSPRARDDRLGLLGMYGPPSGLDPRLAQRPSEIDASKPLNLQVNGNHKEDKDSEGSRTEDEGDNDDDKMSDYDRHDEEDSYDSDEYHRVASRDPKVRPSMGSLHPVNPSHQQGEPVYTDYDSFVEKLNTVLRALVDTARAVERRMGEEKNQMNVELVREKERRQDLEKDLQEERRRREYFQGRVRRLKKSLKMLPDDTPEVTSQPAKNDHQQHESSPEPLNRSCQDVGHIDSDSEKTMNTSSMSEPDRKSDSILMDRSISSRRDGFDHYPSGRHSPNTPPLPPPPVKFPCHPGMAVASDV